MSCGNAGEHGYWMKHSRYPGSLAVCCFCNWEAVISDGRSWEYPKVCPNCHAIMDLPREEPPKLNTHPFVKTWAKKEG